MNANITELAAHMRGLAEAATPQNIDSAEIKTAFADGDSYMECPCCNGEGSVELEANYCNYDNTAIGVQFYGIGNAHGSAEAYFRAATPANVITILDELEAAQAEIERRHGIGGELIAARRERDAALARLAEIEAGASPVQPSQALGHSDADRYRWCINNNMVLAGGSSFGWPIAPVGKQWSEYIDAAINAKGAA